MGVKIPLKDITAEKELKYPFEIKEVYYPSSWVSSLMYHKQYEIHFFKKGRGFYLINSQKYNFNRNTLIIIKPREPHRFLLKEDIEKYSIYFDPLFFDEISNLFLSLPNKINLTGKDITKIELICKTLVEENNRKMELYLNLIKLKLNELFIISYRSLGNISHLEEGNSKIQKVLLYIEENYNKDLKLSEIAQKFSLSPSSLSHLFKQYTGTSPKRYIIEKRIIEAYRILEEKKKEVKTKKIAAMVGFSNYKEFVDKFKKIVGVYPSTISKI